MSNEQKPTAHFFTKLESDPAARQLGRMGSILRQNQVTEVVRKALDTGYDDLTYTYYAHNARDSYDMAAVAGAAPEWVRVRGVVEEPIKLNSVSFWHDLLTRSTNCDARFKADLEASFPFYSLKTISEISTFLNSIFYLRATQYMNLSALLGSGLENCVITQKQPEPTISFPAAMSVAQKFDGPARDFEIFLERMQQIFPTEQSQGSAHSQLVEDEAFETRSVIGKTLKCPAIGLTRMIYQGYGKVLQERPYSEAFRKRILQKP